jgi:hypothetical protein
MALRCHRNVPAAGTHGPARRPSPPMPCGSPPAGLAISSSPGGFRPRAARPGFLEDFPSLFDHPICPLQERICRRLRLGSQRRGEEAARQGSEEDASIHVEELTLEWPAPGRGSGHGEPAVESRSLRLRAIARRCTICSRGQDHQDAIVGPSSTPQCWRSGMPRRLHNWCTHPTDLLSGRAQGHLRAQRSPVVQGRLGGWLLRAQVSPAPLLERRPGVAAGTRCSKRIAVCEARPPIAQGRACIRPHDVGTLGTELGRGCQGREVPPAPLPAFAGDVSIMTTMAYTRLSDAETIRALKIQLR